MRGWVSGLAFLSLGAFGLVVGVLIGCVGIGGVLLVPVLTYVGGIDIQVAIAAAMFSYLFTGAIGAAMYARRRSIRWPMAAWLSAGAMPAAFLGAWASNVLPGGALELAIAVLIIFAGINALRRSERSEIADKIPANVPVALIGMFTGFASALTGTGGPLVLVPILIWLEVPVLTAIGLSQAIQLPIAALATGGNLIYGQLNIVLGVVIAAGLTLGTAIGAHVAHTVSHQLLRTIVAWVLIAVGLFIVARLLLTVV